MKRTLIAGLCLVVAAAVGTTQTDASSADFHYKWPYLWNTSATITTYPFSGVHGCYPNGQPPYECVDAYDLVIGSGIVSAASQGSAFVQGGFAPGECRSNGSYGNFVDIDGVRYAHLDSFAPSVVTGADLLQGDQVGAQGSTGNVQPCPGGVHLHWEFLGSSSTPPIDGGSASSSNSVIGEFSTAGATLRNYYINHGSWNTIGWTHAICPGACSST
jgi:murein DD-endopeptidase MepM/ murein hydrolase activator NlpD